MENQTAHTAPAKKRRPGCLMLTAIAFAALLILLIAFRFSLKSQFVLEMVKSQVEQAVTDQTGARFSIGSIEGDLLGHLTISGILLETDAPLLRADTLELRYRIWPLLSGNVEVPLLRLDGLALYPALEQDGIWNFEKLMVEQDDIETSETTMPGLKFSDIRLSRSAVYMNAPGLLPDSTLTVEDLEVLASFAMKKGEIDASLSKLNMKIREGRLPEPISLESQAAYSDGTITLEKLVINTGRSVLKTGATAKDDGSEIRAEAEAERISGRDLAAYIPELPEFENARFGLRASGKLSALTLELSAYADGLLDANFATGLSLTDDPSLTFFSAEIHKLNPDPFLPDSLHRALSIGSLSLRIDGKIPFDKPETGMAEGKISLAKSSYLDIALDSFSGSFTLSDGTIELTADAVFPGQSIALSANLGDIREDMDNLNWNLRSDFRNIDPGYFASIPELGGAISGNLRADGTGTFPGATPWNYRINLTRIGVAGYDWDSFTAHGIINETDLRLNAALVDGEGSIRFESSVIEWQTDSPAWNLAAEIRKLNLDTFAKIEQLSSDLNVTISGAGKGFVPEEMTARFGIHLDRSFLAGERIDSANVQIDLDKSILRIEDAYLNSRFAVGYIDARQNIVDITDPQNRLDFELSLRNLSAFAEAAGLDILEAEGNISGKIAPDGAYPRFESRFRFTEIIADSINIEQAYGTIGALLKDDPEIELNVDIRAPAYGGISVQDIRLALQANIAETITGTSDLRILREADYGFYHKADFNIDGESVSIRNTALSVLEEDVRLTLVRPFDVVAKGGAVRMDTLSIVSNAGATLDMLYNLDATGRSHVFVNASRFDIGVFQSAILDEVFVDGVFSGSIDADFTTADDLRISTTALLEDMVYGSLQLDLLDLQLQVLDERLTSSFHIKNNGETLFESEFDLPFMPGDPETFADEFFDRPVSGFMRLNRQEISEFSDFLMEMGLAEISGLVSMEMFLDGVAGSPDLSINFRMLNGRVTGVNIDSLGTKLAYDHQNGRMHIGAAVTSLGQKAVELDGSLPFFIDWRTFSITEKEGNGLIDCRLYSNDFNLTAINDFLDPGTARNLRGYLNADLRIGGTYETPEIEGTAQLRGGQLFLVENNITLRNIVMESRIRPDAFILDQLYAESSGSMTLSGRVNLEEFIPQTFDFNLQTRNFRVFNTRDIEVFTTVGARLAGTADNPKLTGEVLLERGFIFLDNFGETPVEQVVLEEEEDYSKLIDQIYDSLEIEMALRIDRRFHVRNRNRPELDLELRGTIDAVKEPGRELELFGAMNIDRGFANQLGRRFTLDDGVIVFSGPPANPELSIRLKYQLRREDDITIWYVIGGDAEAPTFSYESDPEMDLEDIISYTLFGRPFHNLQGWQKGISGGAGESNVVADAALDLLLDRVEALAADRFGIDVLEIDHSSGSGTNIKAGKFVTDRLFVAIVQELSTDPRSQVIIEYMLRRNLDLIFVGSDDYRTGVDILWRKDY